MKRVIFIVFILLELVFAVKVSAQHEEEPQYAVIKFARNSVSRGSSCLAYVTFPNQKHFTVGMTSFVNYKVYSEGRMTIMLEMICPGDQSSSQQLTLNIKRGQTYYILLNEVAFYEIEKEVYLGHFGPGINLLTQKENIEDPIDRTSVDQIRKKKGGQGTCFVISSNGYLVTNNHCIAGCKNMTVTGIDGDFTTKYGATVVATDPSNDLALIKIGNKNIKFNTPSFAMRSSGVAQAEKVYALGFPKADAMGQEVKITEGIISSKSGSGNDISKFQISAAVNPGNSGGPLIDEQGNLIGVIYAKSTVAESAGYAIKASYLETFLKNVESFEYPTYVNTMQSKSFTDKVAEWRNNIFIIEAE